MCNVLSTSALVLLLAVATSAQPETYVHVPDADPTAGPCNVIPFASAATMATGHSYIGRVPAAILDPANPVISDVAFAPCGSGTWSSPDVRIGFGHVPAALPLPLSFPVGGLGSFLSYTEVVTGPFCWQANANTWSPLRLGSGFTWNGTDDVAFYITTQQASITGWGGDCHSTTTEPFRAFTTGFNAAVSTGSGPTGLKMRLTLSPAVYVPDTVSNAGICDTVPFGSAITTPAGYSYVSRVPATSLDPNRRVIHDIAFATCGTGRWSAPQVRIGIGHVPNPMPSPFTFPVGGPGSFLDFKEVVNGPFAFDASTDTWSPLHLGTNFIWNGVDDIGVYITAQNASAPGWAGDCHGLTEPRSIGAAYNAPVSTTSDLAALKIGLATSFNRLDPDFSICVRAFIDSATTILFQNIPRDAVSGLTLVSLTPTFPAASGPVFGIWPDPLVWDIAFTPPTPGGIFAWTANLPSLFPTVPLVLPSGTMTPFSGMTWDFVGLAFGPGQNLLGATNVAQVTWP
jgi:hypothetical protein